MTRERWRPLDRRTIRQHPVWRHLDAATRETIDVVGRVLPFRTNAYVVENLIDWDNLPDDPIFQLTFPQSGMLAPADYATLRDRIVGGADRATLDSTLTEIRYRLNPHPAGQLTANVPTWRGQPLDGLQHKYRETVLLFPAAGQTCHAYCTYCFRWAQFTGGDLPRFATPTSDRAAAYLRAHPDVTDVLITGGDPLVMSTARLEAFLAPLLAVDTVRTLRLGTKAPAYWPQRFVSDPDADDLLRLIERIVEGGRHVAVMAHLSHPVELEPAIARRALARIRSAGAEVRLQAPLIRHVNDDPALWARLWAEAVRLGLVPYYLFVERDTGPRHYFEVPLDRAWRIFQDAYSRVSGLARTVRGPVMSAFPGKVRVLGRVDIAGHDAFVLDLLQARDPAWVRRPFFARFDPAATFFDHLRTLDGQPFELAWFAEHLQHAPTVEATV